MNNMINLDEVRKFISAQSDDTMIYLGSDSERIKIDGKWFADYAVCVVVHIDGKHGCKVFGQITREADYDQKKDRPSMRLMNEVFKVSELFNELRDVLEDRLVEIHLDINRDKKHGSNCVMQEAIGYIKGTCGLTPMLKPESPAASFCADRLKSLI